MPYTIRKTLSKPNFQGQWNTGVWQDVPTLTVAHFHPRSSEHRPITEAKLLYDDAHLYVIFRVVDQYVRAICTTYQQPVCNDSCVEFFVQPDAAKGYFNIEVNCIGTLLLYYIEDPTRTANGFKVYTPVSTHLLRSMTIFHALSGVIEPEIAAPTTWIMEYNIPFTLFETYLRSCAVHPGVTWKGNFYKCGDQTSHPHWASWSPIGAELNFHQPACFGELAFEAPQI